jgi:hypothetical protein
MPHLIGHRRCGSRSSADPVVGRVGDLIAPLGWWSILREGQPPDAAALGASFEGRLATRGKPRVLPLGCGPVKPWL